MLAPRARARVRVRVRVRRVRVGVRVRRVRVRVRVRVRRAARARTDRNRWAARASRPKSMGLHSGWGPAAAGRGPLQLRGHPPLSRPTRPPMAALCARVRVRVRVS